MSNIDMECPSCGKPMLWKNQCMNTSCDIGLINFHKHTVKVGLPKELWGAGIYMGEIKPCKCCGSQNFVTRAIHSNWRSQVLIIMCSRCRDDFVCIKVDCHSDTQTLARNAWNELNDTQTKEKFVEETDLTETPTAVKRRFKAIASREEAVEHIHKGLNHNLDDLRYSKYHYGAIELRDLMDFIYGENPQNEKQEIKSNHEI